MNFRDYLKEIQNGRVRQTEDATPGWLPYAAGNYLRRNSFKTKNFELKPLSLEEYTDSLIRVQAFLDSDIVTTSGAHRLPSWENGWEENLRQFEMNRDEAALIPLYFRPNSVQQLFGNWTYTLGDPMGFELEFLHSIIELVIRELAREYTFDCIVEFGCGTGHNLLHLANRNVAKSYVGVDWAQSSQQILQLMREAFEFNVEGRHFDYFHPDLKLNSGYMALTVASMEQIGESHKPFIDYLISSQPAIVVHFEPIEELLPEDELLASVSRKYFRKRRYLSGYLSALRELENQGIIEIIAAERTGFGSFFIEGYSLVIWQPKVNSGLPNG